VLGHLVHHRVNVSELAGERLDALAVTEQPQRQAGDFAGVGVVALEQVQHLRLRPILTQCTAQTLKILAAEQRLDLLHESDWINLYQKRLLKWPLDAQL
jgi:hypothetical protein